MRFCIFASEGDQRLLRMCVASIRHHHPDAYVLHLSDADGPRFPHADEFRRINIRVTGSAHAYYLRIMHYADMGDEPFVSLDSDTLVCANLESAFDEPCDVALTWRSKPAYRYNAGVMFSRCGAFWRELQAEMERDPKGMHPMWTEGGLVRLVDRGQFKVRELPGLEWNRTPLANEPPPRAKVLHYKGLMKRFMAEHYDLGVWKKPKVEVAA